MNIGATKGCLLWAAGRDNEVNRVPMLRKKMSKTMQKTTRKMIRKTIRETVKKTVAMTVACAFLLSGCAAGGGRSSAPGVGPATSSSYAKAPHQQAATPVEQKPKLDIIIPVFDPGLPDDPANYKKKGIWPELRRSEAVRFAYKMKLALEQTGKFGAVRVMPDKTATGDLYVLGKINQSDGEKVDINIQAYDISGKRWFSKSFEHEVAADFYSNIRNKGKDPYAPVFNQAAVQLVKALKHRRSADLAQLQALTTLRFGANFSEQTFSRYMKAHGSTVSLTGYPAADDPMLARIKAIRIRDQLFADRMQSHYEAFNQKMQDSYVIWQKQSYDELQAEHAAHKEAIGKTVAGIALIGLAVLSVIAGANSNSYGGAAAGTTGAIVAGQVGAGMLGEGSQMRKEAKFHKDALDELGQSVDGEMAPQVVAFEKTSKKLTGSAKEQFAEWRAFLKRMYNQEATPDVQL